MIDKLYARRVRPDVIREAGVASMGRGKVIGVDVEIHPGNRKAVAAPELSDLIMRGCP